MDPVVVTDPEVAMDPALAMDPVVAIDPGVAIEGSHASISCRPDPLWLEGAKPCVRGKAVVKIWARQLYRRLRLNGMVSSQ